MADYDYKGKVSFDNWNRFYDAFIFTFESIDNNKDGLMSYDEMTLYLKKHPVNDF